MWWLYVIVWIQGGLHHGFYGVGRPYFACFFYGVEEYNDVRHLAIPQGVAFFLWIVVSGTSGNEFEDMRNVFAGHGDIFAPFTV